jgi:hypothetical protein
MRTDGQSVHKEYIIILRDEIGGCIQTFPDWVDNEINNKSKRVEKQHKDYGGKPH